MIRCMCLLMLVVMLGACASSPCERTQAYEQARPGTPLQVPEDLSTPVTVSRAPDVAGRVVTRREDGRCLEEPPAYVPPADESAGGN